ncbi:hypothetical protein BJV77DRAFT_963582 [Russula vinacea]|nr:hypothetical protein BJV77DRAFT_963582 [Russula vinacea]
MAKNLRHRFTKSRNPEKQSDKKRLLSVWQWVVEDPCWPAIIFADAAAQRSSRWMPTMMPLPLPGRSTDASRATPITMATREVALGPEMECITEHNEHLRSLKHSCEYTRGFSSRDEINKSRMMVHAFSLPTWVKYCLDDSGVTLNQYGVVVTAEQAAEPTKTSIGERERQLLASVA